MSGSIASALDKLADYFDSIGKPDVPISITSEQASELKPARKWRGHPLRVIPIVEAKKEIRP